MVPSRTIVFSLVYHRETLAHFAGYLVFVSFIKFDFSPVQIHNPVCQCACIPCSSSQDSQSIAVSLTWASSPDHQVSPASLPTGSHLPCAA